MHRYAKDKGDTITKDTAKVEPHRRGFCVDEVMLEDVLGCPNVARDEVVILETEAQGG